MKNIADLICDLCRDRRGRLDLNYLRGEDPMMKSILNTLSEGIIVADSLGKFIYFNPVAEKILGIGMTDTTAGEWASVYGVYYPDESTPCLTEELPLIKALSGEEVKDELLFIRNPKRPEGIYIKVSARPVTGDGGRISGGIVIMRDVTGSRRAKVLQKQSEQRVEAQFRGNPVPTFLWRREGDELILSDYNDAAALMTKGNVKSHLGETADLMFADSPSISEDIIRSFDERATITRNVSFPIEGGRILDVVMSCVFAPPDMVLMHTEDVSARKRAEADIKKLSSAVEQTADSVIITDREGVIEYVNPAFESTTGYTSEEAIGRTPQILKSGLHDREFYADLWKVVLKGEPWSGTIINRKKNGEFYWSEQTITPMKDPDGRITNFVSVLKDITELRARQEQEFQMRIAREWQQRLYKDRIAVPGFDISGGTHSAAETNGDYFDFLRLPDGSLGIVVGDVSGHGIGAALGMAGTRAYLRSYSELESDPAVLLTMLSGKLAADLADEHFVTMIIVRIDRQSKTVSYASAGHVPGYLLGKNGSVKHVYPSTGVPLGILPDYRYEKGGPTGIAPGDVLVLLTDGILETESADGDQFGIERALEVVKKHGGGPASGIVEKLYEAALEFSGNRPQRDDITSVICRMIDGEGSV